MKTKKWGFALVCAILVSSIIMGMQFYQKEKAYSGVPDLVSSFSCNNDYALMVVANSRDISDKENFSREVIEMCRNNSFQSVRFSTDLKGYPENLDIEVYLTGDDIGKLEPEMRIRFLPDEWNAGYNIGDDVDHYDLYVNGEKIDL